MRCVYILAQAGHSKVVTEWENEKKNVLRLEEEVERLREELKTETGTANDREVCGMLCRVTVLFEMSAVFRVWCLILFVFMCNCYQFLLHRFIYVIILGRSKLVEKESERIW